jgi:VIT1/CCC1 family predicted Fe2+/Mn2+ transporter
LQAALARESDAKLAGVRSRFEREHRERLAELEAGYLRMRRRTLGALIGGAFAAGIAVPVALPWFNEQFGRYAPAALAAAGAAIGLCVGVASWFNAQQAPRRG